MRLTKLPWAKKWWRVIELVWRCEARLSLPFRRNGRRPLSRRMSFSRQMVEAFASRSDMSFGFAFSLSQASACAGAARPAATAAAAMPIRMRLRRVVARVIERVSVGGESFSTSFGDDDRGLKPFALSHTFV